MFQKRKTLIRITMVCMLVGLSIGALLWLSYSRARLVADFYMLQAIDGPWQYSKGRFVLSCHHSGKECHMPTPCWIFRYTNPNTHEKSNRVYVDLPEYRAYTWGNALDPVPMLGCRP